jgi:serine phosphatase RsbU (regulator of sigma subunit)
VSVRVAVNSVDDDPGDSVVDGGPPPTPPDRAGDTPPRSSIHAPQRNVAIVVMVGVLITAGLSFGAYSLHDSNEDRLLNQRVREVGVVTGASIPALQTPLASAAVLAESTRGSPKAFRRLMSPTIVLKPAPTNPRDPNRRFASVSLWSANDSVRRPLAVVGDQPELSTESAAAIREVFGRTAGKERLAIGNLLAARERRLGYAYRVSPRAHYVVYAEVALPRQRQARIGKDQAFAELDYAIYLGKTANSRFLLASSTGGALLHGRSASAIVKFGDSDLLVVMSPRTQLGGALLARLWWILGILGLVLTFGAATLVGRLSRRRQVAESLAAENAQLYAEQRTVAQTLQHSLLAEAFPEIEGLEFGARYIAGVEGIDIGGDWYDVVRVDQRHILIVVGDVSGRGLEAATMMASLRFSARAYGAEGHSTGTILTKLSALASVARDGHFATVLCGLLDVTTGRVTVANAGHPAPLLITPTGGEYVQTPIGVPVGVGRGATYEEVEFTFPRGSTLLLYTDGAIERRGERLDVGLQRLKDVSAGAAGSLEAVLDTIVHGVLAEGTEDDTAMLGVRWRD